MKTMPIGNVNGMPAPVDVLSRTTVQRSVDWRKATDTEYQIEQMFQAYLCGASVQDTDEMTAAFYRKYLGYQCGNLLNKSSFFKKSEDLVRAVDQNGIIDGSVLNGLSDDTVTDDIVIVQLEKNVPQRIRMFVWVEGKDPDCTNVKAGGGLLVNLELAGGNEQ